MSVDVAQVAVTALLSGGGAAALATLMTSRSLSRKTDAEAHGIASKAPAERDNVIVKGAEAAVLTMQAALVSAQSRIGELEADRDSDRARIAELEQRLEVVQSRVQVAEDALGDARRVGEQLRLELVSLREARPRP